MEQYSFVPTQTTKHLGDLTQVWGNDELIYQYSLSQIPENAQIGISSRVWLHPRYRGKGLGKRLHWYRLREARKRGFLKLLATVTSENKSEIAILTSFAWILIWEGITSGVDLWAHLKVDTNHQDEWL